MAADVTRYGAMGARLKRAAARALLVAMFAGLLMAVDVGAAKPAFADTAGVQRELTPNGSMRITVDFNVRPGRGTLWGAGILRELRLGRPVLVRAVWTDAAAGQRLDGDLSPLLTDPVGSQTFSFVAGRAGPQQEWLPLSHPSPLVTDCRGCYLRMTGQGKWVFDLTQQNPPPPPDPFNPPGGGGGQQGGGNLGPPEPPPELAYNPFENPFRCNGEAHLAGHIQNAAPDERFGFIIGGTPPRPPNGEPAPPFEVVKQAVPNQAGGHAAEVSGSVSPSGSARPGARTSSSPPGRDPTASVSPASTGTAARWGAPAGPPGLPSRPASRVASRSTWSFRRSTTASTTRSPTPTA